jgi:hypothetical protein
MIGKIVVVPRDIHCTVQRNVAGTSDNFHQENVRNSILGQFGDQAPTPFPTMRSKAPQRFASMSLPWHAGFASPFFAPLPYGATDGAATRNPRASGQGAGEVANDAARVVAALQEHTQARLLEVTKLRMKGALGHGGPKHGLQDTGYLRAASAQLTRRQASNTLGQTATFEFPAVESTLHRRAVADALCGRSAYGAATALADADASAAAAADRTARILQQATAGTSDLLGATLRGDAHPWLAAVDPQLQHRRNNNARGAGHVATGLPPRELKPKVSSGTKGKR